MTWHPGQMVPAAQLTPAVTLAIRTSLTDADTLALTMWAEGRSRLDSHAGWLANPMDAMADIANVVANRVRDPRWVKFGVKGACLAPFQFSCWLPYAGSDKDHDPQHLADNYEALMGRAQALKAGLTMDAVIVNCLTLAHEVCCSTWNDRLGGATHYYAEWIPAPTWSLPPAVQTADRWGHKFFAHVK